MWGGDPLVQYLLYGPFVGKFMYSRIYENTPDEENWCLHLLILSALRVAIYVGWSAFSNMLFLNRNRRIVDRGVDFRQIDKEWNW